MNRRFIAIKSAGPIVIGHDCIFGIYSNKDVDFKKRLSREMRRRIQ
jgi:hypothetical protein